MGIEQDILNKVKTVVDDEFKVEDVTYVPDILNSKLTFGNKGLQFEGIALHIDMRGSTKVLNKHNKTTVAKIHMAYFHTVVKIAKSLGGEVRSFNGDSMLVFFQGTTNQTKLAAVKAAMQMKYMIALGGVNDLLSKYSTINFGIGLDYGNILCTKIGVGKDSNNQDLIWVGNAVNKAVKIGDMMKDPYHIGISKYIYDCLPDNVKYTKNSHGFIQNIWTQESFTYNDQWETYYHTNYHYPID